MERLVGETMDFRVSAPIVDPGKAMTRLGRPTCRSIPPAPKCDCPRRPTLGALRFMDVRFSDHIPVAQPDGPSVPAEDRG